MSTACARARVNTCNKEGLGMNIFKQIKTVLWGFFGVGRRKDMAEIHERGNPLVLVIVAFGLLLLFVAGLASLAHAFGGG